MVHQLFDKQLPKRMPMTAAPESTSTMVDDCEAFGWLRNERDRAVMLEIRHANGDITALSYPLLESAKFNPSTGITLSFSGVTVTITGCNLNTDIRPNVRLFEGLTRHRVVWIQESDEMSKQESNETDIVIDDVRFDEK